MKNKMNKKREKSKEYQKTKKPQTFRSQNWWYHFLIYVLFSNWINANIQLHEAECKLFKQPDFCNVNSIYYM